LVYLTRLTELVFLTGKVGDIGFTELLSKLAVLAGQAKMVYLAELVKCSVQ
jgi:hypothetical protein